MIDAIEAKQLSRAASSLPFTHLEFTTKPNGKYPSEDFLEVPPIVPTGLNVELERRINNGGSGATDLLCFSSSDHSRSTSDAPT